MAQRIPPFILPQMKLAEVQSQALELPESDRAILAAELLISLPAVLSEEDEGVAEAWRRSRELDADPVVGCTWDDIKRAVGR